jgi:SAM-dependent methyltransferase
MFDATADYYDLFYAMKDYRVESRYVAAAIRDRVPRASSVLDVACGTGEHARFLAADHGFRVDGIDLEPALVAAARRKNPEGTFREADMVDFELGRRYDAVVCLFSAIGYVREEANLARAIAAMTRHLAAPGVLLVEPWFEPGAIQDGYVTALTVDTPDGKATRMSRTRIDGSVSHLEFEYLIGTAAGITRHSERHALGLFSRAQMEAAFVTAGLPVEYDQEGPSGRGLYVAWCG